MNCKLVSRLLRVIADLNATTIGVHDGLDAVLVMKDIDEAEQELRRIRLELFRGSMQYQSSK